MKKFVELRLCSLDEEFLKYIVINVDSILRFDDKYPTPIYCDGKMVSSAMIARYLNRCLICDVTFKKLPIVDIR